MSNRPHSYRQILILTGDFLFTTLIYLLLLCTNGVCDSARSVSSLCVTGLVYAIIIITGGVILFRRGQKGWHIVMLCLRNLVGFALFNTLLLYVTHLSLLSVGMSALFYALSFGGSLLMRWLFFRHVTHYRANTKHRRKIVFVGSTENNLQMYDEMQEAPMLGYQVMGYFDYAPNPLMDSRCAYLGVPAEVNDYLSANVDVKEVFCCLPSKDSEDILAIIHYSLHNLINFNSVPNVSNYVSNRMYYRMVGSVPYLSLYVSPLSHSVNRLSKRVFDICLSLLFLITLFVPIFLIVCVITTLTMPGPIFFVQNRNGLNGKTFRCLKFRSMKVNAESDQKQATADDPRVTKWGLFMRKTSLDEIPQFLNVLMGDMSIVGPRPHMVKHTNEYSKLIDKYMVRHLVKPGITGWAQVTGYRGETRELWQMEGRVKQDIWYIEHWSFGLDLLIIWRTVFNTAKGDKQAY